MFIKRRRLFLVILVLLSYNFFHTRAGFCDEELKRRDPHVGRRFHEKTKMIWGIVAKTASILTERHPGARYKQYPDKEKIKLPPPRSKGRNLEKAIKDVLPVSSFASKPISLGELSQILFSADGIIKEDGAVDIRTAPVPLPHTASFTYVHPVEIYLVAHRVSGLKKGLYHYSFLDHSLELIKESQAKIPNCCFEQETLDTAAASIILTGIPRRLTWNYDARSYRYIYMVAGAISQNIYLQCASLGLTSIGTASFHDDAYNSLLGVDGVAEATLLLHLVGKPKG